MKGQEVRPLEGRQIHGEGIIKTRFTWCLIWCLGNWVCKKKSSSHEEQCSTGTWCDQGLNNKKKCLQWAGIRSCKFLLRRCPSAYATLGWMGHPCFFQSLYLLTQGYWFFAFSYCLVLGHSLSLHHQPSREEFALLDWDLHFRKPNKVSPIGTIEKDQGDCKLWA